MPKKDDNFIKAAIVAGIIYLATKVKGEPKPEEPLAKITNFSLSKG